MLMVKITLNIEAEHASSPHTRVMMAIAALLQIVGNSRPDNPALGGDLTGRDGTRLGTYWVEFP